MLRAMRGAAETWIIKVLMVFLVVSFSIWGVGDIFRGNPQQRVVACVGGFYLSFGFFFGSSAAICTGERITVQTLEQDFRRAFDQEQQKRGLEFTQDKAKQQGLMDRILREAAARKLFSHIAHDFTLRYDTNAVLSQLANTPDLRTKDGKFDQQRFRQILSNMHMGEAEFIAYMQETFAREASVGSFGLAAVIPETVYEQVLKAQGLERLSQALRLDYAKMPAPEAPEAPVLEKFYQDNPQLFTAPEYRTISILQIMIADVAKSVALDDAEIAAAFEKRQGEFGHGEQRDILQVVVGNEDAAKSLARNAQNKHNLRQAAEAAKLDAVLLENQTEETIPSTLYTTVFTAEAGTITDPIKTDYGYHVVQIMGIKPPYKPALADVKEELRTKLQREKAQDIVQDLANKVDDELNAGKPLDEIGKAYQLPVAAFGPFDRNGATAAGKEVELPSSGIVLQNSFGLNEEENSALLDDHRGNFLVVHVDKIVPSQVRPFEEAKDKIVSAWKHDQQRQAAIAAGDKLMAEWQQKPDAFAEFGKRPGVTAFEPKPVSLLGGYTPDIPREIQQQLIDLNPGDIKTGKNDDAYFVVRLSGYRQLDPKKNSEAQAASRSLIEKGWRGDILDQFETMLRAEYPVAINQALLDELRRTDSSRNE